MGISFTCPRCFHHYRFKDSSAGKTISCRQCGNAVTVPIAVGQFLRQSRLLRVSDSVRLHLFHLRWLEKPCLAPELSCLAVRDVELELKCLFLEDILGAFANHDGYLAEYGFRIEQVVEQTREAHEQKCPRDLVAVGSIDGHVYYCVPRQGLLNQAPSLTLYDNEDGSTQIQFFPDWLAEQVEGRQSFAGQPTLPDPSAEELEQTCPRLVW